VEAQKTFHLQHKTYKAHRNMINNILDLLEVAKQNHLTGEYVEIALGKNKFPETIKEGYKMLKQELWQRK